MTINMIVLTDDEADLFREILCIDYKDVKYRFEKSNFKDKLLELRNVLKEMNMI